jgi:hypothetical protein
MSGGGAPAPKVTKYNSTPKGGGDLGLGFQTGVMPFSPNQTAAFDQLGQWGKGNVNPAYQQAIDAVKGVDYAGGASTSTLQNIARNGLGASGDQAMAAYEAQLKNPMGAMGDSAARYYKNLAQDGLGTRGDKAAVEYASQLGSKIPSATSKYLTDVTQGKYLTPDSNPYLKGMYEAASRPMIEQFNTQIAPGIAAQFSGSGRYGAPSQAFVGNQAAGRLADTLGDMSSNLYGQAYSQERGFQQGAANDLNNITQQDYARQQNAASGLGNLGAQEAAIRAQGASGLAGMAGQNAGLIQNAAAGMGSLAGAERGLQASAAQGLGGLQNQRAGMQLQAAGMLPGMAGAQDQATMQRINALQQSGAPYQQQGQNIINAAGSNYGAGQQAPWQNLQNLAGILNGGGNFGTQTQTGGGGSQVGNAIGGAAGGALAGSMFGPWGAGIGGGLGLLGGLF